MDLSDQLAPVDTPINGVLDLHLFKPRDVKEVVMEFLEACREKQIFEVRIIHGKGIGQLRQTVHTLLAAHPGVADFHLAHEQFGGWGATVVHLRR